MPNRCRASVFLNALKKFEDAKKINENKAHRKKARKNVYNEIALCIDEIKI